MKKTSMNLRGNLEQIPVELIIEIFSRLPPKSIALCRCVSKQWVTILGRQDFTELFLTISSARPKLLFAFQTPNEDTLFFSSSHPQAPNENSSINVASSCYRVKSNFGAYHQSSKTINGMVFLRYVSLLREKWSNVSLICNPSTGQYLTLPIVDGPRMKCYFGYDPIVKRFKVLLTDFRKPVSQKILTLGTRKPSWRKIECCTQHILVYEDICINSVLYYPAILVIDHESSRVIVCFDFRSEKFTFVTVKDLTLRFGTIINYNGKLGLLQRMDDHGPERIIKFTVLEDVEKQDWTEHTYVLTSLCRNVVPSETILCFVGVTKRNEIVLATQILSRGESFYVLYYNIEKNTLARVEIRGMEASPEAFPDGIIRVCTLLDHVENVELLQGL